MTQRPNLLGRRGSSRLETDASGPMAGGVRIDASDELELTRPGPRAQCVMILILLAAIAGLVLVTFRYSEKGRLFPLITLAAMGALVLLQAVLVLAELRRGSGGARTSPSTLRREATVTGWIGILALSILLFGMLVGTGLFFASYLMASRACRPMPLFLLVSITMAALYGMFVMVLSARLPGGLLL